MSAQKYLEKAQDDYEFLLCCNLDALIQAWEDYDGEEQPVVFDRSVDERSLVYALQELGYEAVI